MGESRGKKSKKANWHVQLGVKELIFSALGVALLVVLSFALGTLAGRGDIYRVLHNWGFLGPDSGMAGQIWYQAPPPPTPPMATLSNPHPQEAPPVTKTAPHQESVVDKIPPSAPVKGSVAAPSNPAQAKKKTSKPDVKAKEDKLEKIRQEVASKLKFQNSLDLAATKTTHGGDKAKKGGDKEHAPPAKASTSPIVIAKFRDATQARTKLTQMQKQGEKVILKEGKDEEGRYLAICRQVTPSPPASPPVAPAQGKKTKVEKKPKPEAGRETTRR